MGDGVISSHIIKGYELEALSDFIKEEYQFESTNFVLGYLDKPIFDLAERIATKLQKQFEH